MVTQYDDDTPQPAAPAPPDQPAGGLSAEPTGELDPADREQLQQQIARLQAQLRETAPAASDEPFTRNTWQGHTLFQCRYCPWTTFDEQAAYEHQTSPDYRPQHRANPDFPG